MTQPVYVSPNGLEMLRARVANIEAALKLLRDEKLTAYTGSGDGWHDNPFFNKLEQDERSTARQLAELLAQVARVQVIAVGERPTDAVRLGSIVEIERTEPGRPVSREVWEIVGFGESDRAQRKLAYTAPLASVLLGQEEGAVVTFRQARGEREIVVNVEVVGLHPAWAGVEG